MVSALTGEDWDVKDREGLIDWIETKGGEVTDEGQYNLHVRMPRCFWGNYPSTMTAGKLTDLLNCALRSLGEDIRKGNEQIDRKGREAAGISAGRTGLLLAGAMLFYWPGRARFRAAGLAATWGGRRPCRKGRWAHGRMGG